MGDVIKLLPDSVANQIAAGEVIQRPASAVKELMENALDAGASHIKLIVKDAGKTLIQVVDDGVGMTQTDARLCFERHATSKIGFASDLFSIQTMGFRGEALASIAAIARVELKTKTHEESLGTEVIIEGSDFVSQNPCQCHAGTSITVKNLFFNTPARRNFLKSEQIEKNHIFNEFVRLAISRPEISFSFYQNNQLSYKLDASNLKQRIVALLGHAFQQRLVPVSEQTDIIRIDGFVVKPEFAKKKRGDQYFYINKRYIRSAYLSHSVEQAFLELIPEDMYPSFFLFLEMDPSQIDVNVHPTKTEVKFQDERYIYQIIKSSVKRSLGKFNITPALDFEREMSFEDIPFDKHKLPVPPKISIDPDYNPFSGSGVAPTLAGRANSKEWEKLFAGSDSALHGSDSQQETVLHEKNRENLLPGDMPDSSKRLMQLQHRFILAPVKSGIMVIDQQRAHERILYERFLAMLMQKKPASQQLLFPETVILMDQDLVLLREMMPQLEALGFVLEPAKKGTYIITAVPVDLIEKGSLQEIVEGVIEQYRIQLPGAENDSQKKLALAMAKKTAIRHGHPLDMAEMASMIESLFACQLPYQSPSGKTAVVIIGADELALRFK